MPDTIVLKGFKEFTGKHCETTALKHVLDFHGLNLSEEMLLGLGGGVGFIYWYMKNMNAPFIGARNGKIPDFLINACHRAGAEIAVFETSSPKKAYTELKAMLLAGQPAVVYGDMAYLPYFLMPETAHFGGHSFVVFGLDEEKDKVHIYDRSRSPVSVSISDLEKARNSKYQPFPPKNRLLKVKPSSQTGELEAGIIEAIRDSCRNMLRPPIKNFGLAGMEKWAKLVLEWPQQFKGMDLLGVLMNGFIYIETGGTGGSGFRTMYAMFLEEASVIVGKQVLNEASILMRESAKAWSEIARGYLPDSCPALKRIRELMIEKNGLFEEQGKDALEAIKVINKELDILMTQTQEELDKAPSFLKDVQQSILKCLEIEKKTFQMLDNAF